MKKLKTRDKNIGASDYAKQKIQPYDIYEAYPDLNYWECDIIKRVLRHKEGEEILDFDKIIHIAETLKEMYKNGRYFGRKGGR